MTKEEAQKRGYEIKPSKQTIKKRAPWHDYRECGTYMITMIVRDRRPLLGELEVWENLAQSTRGQEACTKGAGQWRPLPSRVHPSGSVERPAPGGSVAGLKARVALSPLGETILKEELPKIHRFYPNVEVWRVCIMPDHIHIILRIVAPMKEGKHLGSVICGFKTGCNKAYRNLAQSARGQETGGRMPNPSLGSSAQRPALSGSVKRPAPGGSVKRPAPGGSVAGLFDPGYNDQILFNGEQLDRWKHYLDDNPRRLALKRLHPDLFTVRHNRPIGQWRCQMVGNLFLLDIPDKVAVIVHRADSEEEYARKKTAWLSCGERGGVIVSAAISPREKAVMREAFDRGYRTILLRENGFPPLYKPSGESFNACTSGLMLQISPWEYHHDQQTISRAQCLELNSLAEEIARM